MKKFLVCLLSLCCFLFAGCGKQEEQVEKNLGSVVKTTVEILVSFFNDEIHENSGLSPLTNDTPTMENENYRYELKEEGIYFTVTPIDKPSSKEKDFVKSMQICFSEADDPVAAAYAKLLVVANNNEITREEADNLVTEAKNLTNGESSNNGKGISVKYVKTEDHYEYQVIRNNK